jgi:hypothetical protein
MQGQDTVNPKRVRLSRTNIDHKEGTHKSRLRAKLVLLWTAVAITAGAVSLSPNPAWAVICANAGAGGATGTDGGIPQHTACGFLADAASGVGSSAYGAVSEASGTNSSAYGAVSEASGTNSSAFGADSTASGDFTSAFGADSTASHDNSAAFGAGATTTRADQQVFGTSSNTYTTPGITSAASKTAQGTPTHIVTSNMGGDLAAYTPAQLGLATQSDVAGLQSNINRLGRRDNELTEGLAAVVSLAQPVLLPGQHFAMRAGWGGYDDANAVGLSAAGVVASNIMSQGRGTLTLDGGVGFGTSEGEVAGRAGMSLGW